MSRAKAAAAASNANQQQAQAGSSSGRFSFAQGFILGQLTLALILFCFIKFFIFGDPPSADSRASARASQRRQRTLSHSASLRRRSIHDRGRSTALLNASAARPTSTTATANVLTTEKILEKTYYNVDGHQPESLDWFNVLIAQTIAQLRADALDGDAVLHSLTSALNGPGKPHFLDDIRVTEISLGDEFPIFSNCRVVPVDENGAVLKGPPPSRAGAGAGARKGYIGESRLQARMDVDLSDVVTLGVETKLVLNYPKPFVAVLPVALSVSIVRFSGTLSLSFTPSQAPPEPAASVSNPSSGTSSTPEPTSPTHSPTTLTFTFLDDYRLDLSVHSLVGSRSRLQDVPKIAQLVEQRLHAWFDERCVEPRFQQIVLPSLWPRKRNVRGGADVDADAEAEAAGSPTSEGAVGEGARSSLDRNRDAERDDDDSAVFDHRRTSGERERDRREVRGPRPMPRSTDSHNYAPTHGPRRANSQQAMTEEERLAEAGAEIREAEERDEMRQRREMEHERERERERKRDADAGLGGERQGGDGGGMRRRPPGALGLGHSREGSSWRVRTGAAGGA